MTTKLIALALLIAPLFSLSVTRARAEECRGPWVQAPVSEPGFVWADESKCECGAIRGGMYASSQRVGWLWTQGVGVVAAQLEYFRFDAAGNRIVTTLMPHSSPRVDASPFSAANGLGIEGGMYPDPSYATWSWTGRYQAVCETWD